MIRYRILRVVLVGIAALAAAIAVGRLMDGDRQAHAAPGQGPGLADLIVQSITPRNQFGGDCTVPAGVDVVVKNIGTGAAVASVTHVLVGAGPYQDVSTPGLSAGQSVTLHPYVYGNPVMDTYTATADPPNDVPELDETNNSRSESLSVTTLPTCTPSPSPTPPVTPPAVGGIAQLAQPDAGAEAVSSDGASSAWPIVLVALAAALVVGGLWLGVRARRAR